MIYLFVARDSDMIVFENHLEKQVQAAKFQADIFEVLNNYQDIDDIEARPKTQVTPLIFDNLKLHIMFDTIYYGLISSNEFAEEKAQRLLSDVREEVKKMYKGNVQFMMKQTNLERNCLDKFLRPKITLLLENYNTNISSKNLNAAF